MDIRSLIMNEELVKELNKMVYSEEDIKTDVAIETDEEMLDPDLYIDSSSTNESTLFKYLIKKFNVSEAIETPAQQLQKPGLK